MEFILSWEGITLFEQVGLIMVLVTGVAALVYAWFLAREVLREDPGTPKMQEVSDSIREGSVAYLNKQMEVVIPISFVLAIFLFLTAYLADAPWAISIGRGAALLLGASCSLAIGQIGLRMIGTRGNTRVASQARRGSFQGSLRVAYRSGTIAGMLADGLGLLGGTTIFLLYGHHAPEVLLGFGFGGTLLAMFMRVGGGIYTKAADVGADLVGKVEAGIPEDDPRNAAVIADLVGDNVGDFSDHRLGHDPGVGGDADRPDLQPQVDRLSAAGARHRRFQFDHRYLRRLAVAYQGGRLPCYGPLVRSVFDHLNHRLFPPGLVLRWRPADVCGNGSGHLAGRRL
jgi:hypothetical protein